MTETFCTVSFWGCRPWDKRLDARLVRMGKGAMARPDASLPRMMSTDGELEATYRFVNHAQLRPDAPAGTVLTPLQRKPLTGSPGACW